MKTPTRDAEWSPPSGTSSEHIVAGVFWDAVRVPEYLGSRTVARLGDACGALIRDPYIHWLTWLVAPGATAGWPAPGTTSVQLLGAAQFVEVPPAGRTRSASMHWARAWTADRRLTDADVLRAALEGVLAEAGVSGEDLSCRSGL